MVLGGAKEPCQPSCILKMATANDLCILHNILGRATKVFRLQYLVSSRVDTGLQYIGGFGAVGFLLVEVILIQ